MTHSASGTVPELGKLIRVPVLACHLVSVDHLVTRVDRVEVRAESATHEVSFEAEPRLSVQFSARSRHIRLLSHHVDLLRVEHERIRRLASEDKHLRFVELESSHRRRLDEIRIVNFDVSPAFLSQAVSVFAAGRVRVDVARLAAVKDAYHEEARVRGLTLLARHQVDFLAVHDDCRGVGDWVRQLVDAEPVVGQRVERLTIHRLVIRLDEATHGQDVALVNEGQRRTKASDLHLVELSDLHKLVDLEAIS